jgi:hypothetical protein
MLTAHKVRRDTLIKSDGQPLTIGDVKTQINLWLTTYGAENPEDTIFAMAGMPAFRIVPAHPPTQSDWGRPSSMIFSM